jgi:hypothetical protein
MFEQTHIILQRLDAGFRLQCPSQIRQGGIHASFGCNVSASIGW